MTRAWAVVLGGAILAPLVTWLPMLALQWPRIGLPLYPPAVGIDLWSTQALWLTVLAVIAALVWDDDRWLAAAVVLAGLTLFWRGARLDPTHSVLFAFGAMGVWALRRAPAGSSHSVIRLLPLLGAFQALYIVQQALFQYDVLWMIWGGPRVPVVQPLGTLGTVDAATGYVAITAPLMPVWFLPVAIYAVWAGKSLTAITALAVGLLASLVIAMRRDGIALSAARALAVVVTLPLFAVLAWQKWVHVAPVVAARTGIWDFGLRHAAMTDPVLGWGLGGWFQNVPALQMQARYFPTGEAFAQAHSDPVQWLTETGAVGAILLIGWLVSHRHMFAHPKLGAALTALGVESLGFFPLHVVSTALVALLMIAYATPRDPHPAFGG